MYEIERGNFVAYRPMGGERYMNIVRHQNRGIAVGEDTDMIQEEEDQNEQGENAESEAEEDDVSLASSTDNCTTALNTLRSAELNQCLMRHDYPRAAVFRHVMVVGQCKLGSGARGPAEPTELGSSRLRSGSAHRDLALAVGVRQCPLRSGAGEEAEEQEAWEKETEAGDGRL
eukprot:s92_g2.t1